MEEGAIVVGVAGLSKVGKTTLGRALATSLGCQLIGFGDFVRRQARAHGMPDDDLAYLMELGHALVTADARGVAAAVLEQGGPPPKGTLVLDGIRHLSVIEALHSLILPGRMYLLNVGATVDARAARLEKAEKISTVEAHSLLQILDQHPVANDAVRISELADRVVSGETATNVSVDQVVRSLKLWQRV